MLEIKIKKALYAPEGKMLLDIEAEISKGQFVSITGSSGSGKTSLLKMISGLMKPDEGFIKYNGETWFERGITHLKPQERKIGMVFQDYALFPNMTVRQSLEFVAKENKNAQSVKDILEITGLGKLQAMYPEILSGGQKQRVALARALVRKPDILLLDEPLSALDYEMRLKLQDEIARIHRTFNLTTILISHEPSEIYRLSNLVIELEKGKVRKSGKPSEIYEQQELSGKIQLLGEVIEITQQDIVFIASIISGNKILKVIITREEAGELTVGDRVLVSSKAFNPVVMKLGK